MSVLIILIILISILQLILCKFSLWFIIGVICRLLFSMRCMGIIFKARPLMIGEGVSVGLMVLFYMLFKKDAFPWIRCLEYAGTTILVILFEVIDGLLYVYEVVDEDDL